MLQDIEIDLTPFTKLTENIDLCLRLVSQINTTIKNNNIIIKYFFILIKNYILNNSSQYAQYLALNKIKLSQDCLLLIISLLSLTV